MGVTVTIAVLVWLAGSYLEYKIITAIPWLRPLFHGLPGICISLAIGFAVGWATGASQIAGGFVIGQFFGLATNDITFRFYTKMAEANQKRHVVTSKYHDFRTNHQTVYHEARTTAFAGLKVLGAILFSLLWLLGLPNRIYRMLSQRRLNPQ